MEEIINSFGIKWEIFVAEIFNFLLLIGILYYFLFRKIFENLDKRREIIADGIKKSEQAEEVLEEAKQERAEIVKEARMEADEKIKQALDLAKNKEAEIIKEANKKSAEIISENKNKAEKLKEKIISDADQEIAKLAILGAEKILQEK